MLLHHQHQHCLVQVLQRICDGVAAFIMDRADYTVPMARVAARELLDTCVLKQIIALFTPYNLNKVGL